MRHRTRAQPGEEPKWTARFLLELSAWGNVQRACRRARVARQVAYQRRDSHAPFRAQWAEALEVATEKLEEEARRRAEHGVLKPILHQGKVVAKIHEYSDTLLIFLLKAHKPDKYRETIRQQHSGPNDEPLRFTLNIDRPGESPDER